MIIAVTGSIGAGKSTTAAILGRHGYTVVDVDKIGHELLNESEVRDRLRAEFGVSILDRIFNIDRQKLSKLVFANPASLEKLNRIVHPPLKRALQKKLSLISGNIVIDVALYNELEVRRYAEVTILIQTQVDHIYQRLVPRYTKREILNVMNNQQVVAKPDFIIENNGTVDELTRRIEQILSSLH
jgi:dephospho-CoA kinase